MRTATVDTRARAIGVVADTHGLLRPEALRALRGSDLIIHAGDVGTPEVLEGLREIAPVVVVRGNTDRGRWAASLPERVTLRAAPFTIGIAHDVTTLGRDVDAAGLDVVIAGHSHRPSLARRGRRLLLNPGSIGPRRFTLPVALARLRVDARALRIAMLELDVTSGGAARIVRRSTLRPALAG